MNEYILDKAVWTEKDFDQMGWHDAQMHGMCFQHKEGNWTGDLAFDIDYIFKWVHPAGDEKHFTFWISPCTLIFHDVIGLKIDIDTADYSLEPIDIADMKMDVKKKDDLYEYSFEIELHSGQIAFKSYKGYSQIVRMLPNHVEQQMLLLSERGGISFDTKPCK